MWLHNFSMKNNSNTYCQQYNRLYSRGSTSERINEWLTIDKRQYAVTSPRKQREGEERERERQTDRVSSSMCWSMHRKRYSVYLMSLRLCCCIRTESQDARIKASNKLTTTWPVREMTKTSTGTVALTTHARGGHSGFWKNTSLEHYAQFNVLSVWISVSLLFLYTN